MDALTRDVAALMEQVAAEVILPRYRNLAAHEVEEKSAGELVTIADRESELRLNDGLARLLPEAGLVGEEACAVDPALADRLSSGLNWLVDPIDGTGNFAAGRPPFGIMVALVDGGETQAGWLYDPLSGRLCHAARGRGATIDGEAVRARASGAALPIAGLSLMFVAPEQRQALVDRAARRLEMVPIPRCAAEQYPRIVLGVNDLAVFERTLAWDHAAGALFVEEAGGKVARPDGTPYRPDQKGNGLIAAGSPAMWEKAVSILYG